MVVRVVCVEMIELQDNSQICIQNNYGTTEQKEKKTMSAINLTSLISGLTGWKI